jgi:hypothetical protein
LTPLFGLVRPQQPQSGVKPPHSKVNPASP